MKLDMDNGCDKASECKVRMDAATDLLTLASARLKDVIFSGSDEAIDSAYTFLRFARMRFLEAKANCLESLTPANR
jgi:hypothetical protein